MTLLSDKKREVNFSSIKDTNTIRLNLDTFWQELVAGNFPLRIARDTRFHIFPASMLETKRNRNPRVKKEERDSEMPSL